MILRPLYSLLFICLIPFILLRLFWRGCKAPDYRKRIAQRFGFYSEDYSYNGICLHAVSVGELMAAKPLILKLKNEYPHLPLTITTTTPTASRQVEIIFGQSVQHVYLPYDYPFAVKRFLAAFKPRLFIIMETEIWPNLFYYLKQQHIPLVIANARLAEKSLKSYKKLKFFFASVLHNVTCIAAQSDIDADHFKQLCATNIKVMGNLKYDVPVPGELINKARRLQKNVWIASSTHPAEEDFIINTAIALRKQLPDTLCIIAPRHPERFDALAEKCLAHNLKIARHSQAETVLPETDILLADTLGELFYFYALADIAVVCGSFAPIGGHNLLEPASLGIPIIVGPQMFHFKAILADFLQHDALLQIQTKEELLPTLLELFENKLKAQQMGSRAHDLVLKNQGAVLKVFNILQPLIDLN